MKKYRTIITVSADLSDFDSMTAEDGSALAAHANAWRNSSLRILFKDDATEPHSEADVFTAPGGESS